MCSSLLLVLVEFSSFVRFVRFVYTCFVGETKHRFSFVEPATYGTELAHVNSRATLTMRIFVIIMNFCHYYELYF